MRSIRRRITIWLWIGLGVLWTAGGTAIYLSSRTAMVAAIDTQNQGLARQIRAMSRGGGPGSQRHHQDGNTPEVIPDGIYYQVWNLDGDVLLRSEKLGEQDLPHMTVRGEATTFASARLGSGLHLRVAATQFAAGRAGRRGSGPGRGGGGGSGEMNQPVLVVVASDLAAVEKESRKLLGWLAAIGVLAAAGTSLLLAFALRDGLRPLRKLGDTVAEVDAHSLHARFGADDMPGELQPIAGRLDDLMERLEAGFQRERRFGADLAHELRTPIAELQSMADLSLKWPQERTEQQMRDIRAVSNRMERVVESLLHLARLEGEGAQADRQNVRLADLIDDVWKSHASTAEERRLMVQFDWPPDATMPGDPDLWLILLGNLLANAAEHAAEGGRIQLTRGDDSLRIANSVEGLEASQVGPMFERFWRADRSRTGNTHSGLGLSLAKGCAEAMGLQIAATLQDEPDGETLLVIEVRERAA